MTASSLGRSAMDTHLIEHIIKIAEEKSITKAAEKLYLTQSALNQQLLKLERELGRSSAPKAGPMPKSATLRAAIKGPFPLA